MKTHCMTIPVSEGYEQSKVLAELRTTIDSGTCCLFTFINPHAYYLAENNSDYLSSLHSIDIVLCDGIGIVVAGKLLKLKLNRLSFDSTSLAIPVLQLCAENNWNIYLIGGKPGVAEQASKQMKQFVLGLKIVGTSSGYYDNQEIVIDNIKRSNAQVVICGMGAPYQEKFLLSLRESGWKGAAFSCGGYFDQLSEGLQYYPKLIDKLNLRFLYRIIREPSRLWKRYFLEYSSFSIYLLKELFSIKTRRTSNKLDASNE